MAWWVYYVAVYTTATLLLWKITEAGPKHGPKNQGHSSSLGGERVGDAWIVSHQKGIMKGQSLTFQFIQHPTNTLHSCYRVTCTGTHCPGKSIFISSTAVRVCVRFSVFVETFVVS